LRLPALRISEILNVFYDLSVGKDTGCDFVAMKPWTYQIYRSWSGKKQCSQGSSIQ
jgi:hypothetical protein